VALLFGTDLNYKINSLYSQRTNDAISESPARGIQWLGGVSTKMTRAPSGALSVDSLLSILT
jgi:hypothetical protein